MQEHFTKKINEAKSKTKFVEVHVERAWTIVQKVKPKTITNAKPQTVSLSQNILSQMRSQSEIKWSWITKFKISLD